MATSSFSTSNVKDTMVAAFFSGAGTVKMDWEETFDWRDDQVAAIRKAPWAGIGNFGTWDGKADLTQDEPDALDAQPMTYVIYAVQVRLSMFDLEEVPNIRAETLRKIGFSAASTVAAAAASAKANGFTVADCHGSKTLLATNHEVRGGGTRSNKITAALDRASFLLATNMVEKWKNYDNQLHDLSGAGYFLEFPTDLKETAKQALRSSVTSSQNQYNAAADEDVQFVKNGYLGDANDWFVSVRAPGFKPWLGWRRKKLMIVGDWDRRNMRDIYNVVVAVGFGNKGVPDGIVGASVA